MVSVAALWRHPIKSHGREALTEVTLTEGGYLYSCPLNPTLDYRIVVQG